MLMHSLIRVHVRPLPENPDLQEQVNDPAISVHVPLIEHVCVPVVHSLMFVHTAAEPVYPVLHGQVNEPVVSTQVEMATGQLCIPSVHSSIDVHKRSPLPV